MVYFTSGLIQNKDIAVVYSLLNGTIRFLHQTNVVCRNFKSNLLDNFCHRFLVLMAFNEPMSFVAGHFKFMRNITENDRI